jgi:hypothetical protein
MAVAVLGSGNAQYGVPLPEVGISVKTVTTVYKLEINVPILDNVGEVRGKVKSTKVSRDITVDGEVTGATGVMAWGFLTACVPANNISRFGDGTGTPLLDEVTITDQRAEWEMFSAKLSSNPGLVL